MLFPTPGRNIVYYSHRETVMMSRGRGYLPRRARLSAAFYLGAILSTVTQGTKEYSTSRISGYRQVFIHKASRLSNISVRGD